MSLTKKTVTGYKDSLFTAIAGKIDGVLADVHKENQKRPEGERLTDEEILFEAHKRVFNTIKTTNSYTRDEARAVIINHYLLNSKEISEKLDGKIAERIAKYPVFSDCMPTKSSKNYSIRINGNMYCSGNANSHCKLVDECVSDVMRLVHPQIVAFIEDVDAKERIELLQSVIPFVKHETAERIRIERCNYSTTLIKPVMSFSSVETLKGFALRQSMPFVVHAYMKKKNELPNKNSNENSGESV